MCLDFSGIFEKKNFRLLNFLNFFGFLSLIFRVNNPLILIIYLSERWAGSMRPRGAGGSGRPGDHHGAERLRSAAPG